MQQRCKHKKKLAKCNSVANIKLNKKILTEMV
ncbi:MAG: hypothetical protein ACI8UX_000399, partial [Psychromonas sp.]